MLPTFGSLLWRFPGNFHRCNLSFSQAMHAARHTPKELCATSRGPGLTRCISTPGNDMPWLAWLCALLLPSCIPLLLPSMLQEAARLTLEQARCLSSVCAVLGGPSMHPSGVLLLAAVQGGLMRLLTGWAQQAWQSGYEGEASRPCQWRLTLVCVQHACC